MPFTQNDLVTAKARNESKLKASRDINAYYCLGIFILPAFLNFATASEGYRTCIVFRFSILSVPSSSPFASPEEQFRLFLHRLRSNSATQEGFVYGYRKTYCLFLMESRKRTSRVPLVLKACNTSILSLFLL